MVYHSDKNEVCPISVSTVSVFPFSLMGDVLWRLLMTNSIWTHKQNVLEFYLRHILLLPFITCGVNFLLTFGFKCLFEFVATRLILLEKVDQIINCHHLVLLCWSTGDGLSFVNTLWLTTAKSDTRTGLELQFEVKTPHLLSRGIDRTFCQRVLQMNTFDHLTKKQIIWTKWGRFDEVKTCPIARRTGLF